jgi:hypothetical protein
MIKARVSEETPNLSHPSNLNSTIRLENSSPSLMRLIKANGRNHSWSWRNLGEMPREREEVEEILVRGQEAFW